MRTETLSISRSRVQDEHATTLAYDRSFERLLFRQFRMFPKRDITRLVDLWSVSFSSFYLEWRLYRNQKVYGTSDASFGRFTARDRMKGIG